MSASSDSESGLEGVEQELLNLRAALGLNYRKVHIRLRSPFYISDCPPTPRYQVPAHQGWWRMPRHRQASVPTMRPKRTCTLVASPEQCPVQPQALLHSKGSGPSCLLPRAVMRACCLLPRRMMRGYLNRSGGGCVGKASMSVPSIAPAVCGVLRHRRLASHMPSSPARQERKAFAIRRSLEHNLALQERLRGMLASMDRSQQTNADLRSQVDALRRQRPHRSAGAGWGRPRPADTTTPRIPTVAPEPDTYRARASCHRD